jgi:hypothetical protein
VRPFRIYLLLLICATLIAAWPPPQRQDPGLPALDDLLPHIHEVPQRPRVLGYERDAFGAGWAPAEGCTVREMTLADAGGQLADCRVTGGTGTDPYTGDTIDLGRQVEIDHIYPLSAAWDLGAHRWEESRREAFANDPLNLVATSRTSNREKSDHLPTGWLPGDRGAHCWYARRLALVAATWELPLPSGELKVMRRACQSRVPGGDWLGLSPDH